MTTLGDECGVRDEKIEWYSYKHFLFEKERIWNKYCTILILLECGNGSLGICHSALYFSIHVKYFFFKFWVLLCFFILLSYLCIPWLHWLFVEACRIFCCYRAWTLRRSGSVLWFGGSPCSMQHLSSQTRDWIRVSCTGRQIPNH